VLIEALLEIGAVREARDVAAECAAARHEVSVLLLIL
jgi:hypothetical protein